MNENVVDDENSSGSSMCSFFLSFCLFQSSNLDERKLSTVHPIRGCKKERSIYDQQ